MALGVTHCVALSGLDGHVVDVEADLANGLPAFTITGLPDTSLGEARDRVRAACHNSGVALPTRRITVNLSPASLPKAGTAFDVAIAVAVLVAGEVVPEEAARGVVHLGELGLDGRVRAVRGVLPAVLAAARRGIERVVVPAANVAEASLVPGVRVHGARSLAGLVAAYRGEAGGPEPVDDDDTGPDLDDDPAPAPDLADVVGQDEARQSLEVAAAGGHHLFLLGPPGAGKTMLAARLPSLLPDLDGAAALEVTAVHSLAGALPPGSGLVLRPPFVDPHHTASAASVVGGGVGVPRPGAASRAHHGVLFLDEAPEFERRVLDALRQPLEEGELVIHRSAGHARYPARFQLVLAANPCPCGRASGKGTECTCTPMARRRYLHRLSGPLLDRVDLRVQVLPVTRAALSTAGPGVSSATVAARVAGARAAQRERWRGTPWRLNAHVPGHELRRGRWRLPPASTKPIDLGIERGTITVRGYDRVLRSAWTLADLGGRSSPVEADVSLAYALRQDAA
ncbi:YifB family Mg chelatase-like AAA ATPase [Angustibacter peucedani]